MPATSPARTIDTYSSSKILGCLDRASANALPSLTAVRTSPTGTFRRTLSVCSNSVLSDSASAMPLRRSVASWRVKLATSLFLTPAKIAPRSTSFDRPLPALPPGLPAPAPLPPCFDSSTEVTTTPSLRRSARTSLGDSASLTPFTDLPLGPMPLYAYITMG